jgi:ABC-type transporter Mla subunit MlaD
MDIHIHHHSDPALCCVVERLGAIERKLETMSAALDRLTNEVAETKTAVDSVLTLVDGLADQIRALKDDPAKLAALADELDANQADIAAKVLQNTPSEE